MTTSVLIIEDEPALAANIETYLQRHDCKTATSPSGETGLKLLESFCPDLVLLDYKLPDTDGLEVLKQIRAASSTVKVIMMTGSGNIRLAVEAMKAGAYDYLNKPLSLSELKVLVEKAAGQARLETTLDYYQSKEAERSGLAKMIGVSPAITAVKTRINRFVIAEQNMRSGTPPAVLITGETGTGKELVARAFHFDGVRRDQPFVEINCATIPADLVEAELFGYERGAFTDAKQRKLGLIEAAHGGTLFLDEIGEMNAGVQAKLLTVLENKKVRRLGSIVDRDVDVRIVAATNRALENQVRSGDFRSDLFYRLRIIHVDLPPLRDRGDDVLLLARAFLEGQARRYGRSGLTFTRTAEQTLLTYQWPGNVRELRNVIEQSVLLTDSAEVDVHHLMLDPGYSQLRETHGAELAIEPSADFNLERMERHMLDLALRRTDWNVSQAAELLGVSRDTLRYRITKYELRAPQ